jgi:hypothetical protein
LGYPAASGSLQTKKKLLQLKLNTLAKPVAVMHWCAADLIVRLCNLSRVLRKPGDNGHMRGNGSNRKG